MEGMEAGTRPATSQSRPASNIGKSRPATASRPNSSGSMSGNSRITEGGVIRNSGRLSTRKQDKLEKKQTGQR